MTTMTHGDKQVVPLWIDGAPVLPTSLIEIHPVIQSSSTTTVHHYHSATVSTANAAVSAASAAFPSWSRTSHVERRAILLRFVDLLEQHAHSIGDLQSLETSCTTDYGRFMPKLACEVIREIAGSMTAALSGSVPPPVSATSHGFVSRNPVGVGLIIPPWNSPTVLGPRGIASALAAGCTVVLKASELCPRTYLRLVELFEEAGLPKGVLNMVVANRSNAAEVTEALIAHPAVRKVEFIGSAAVGRVIGQLGAKYLKPVLMELGGKGPVLVLKDANLRKAAMCAAYGAFLHHGQICFSTERIIVVKDVADEFCKLLTDEVSTTYAEGPPGAAATRAFGEKSQALIEAAKANGAEFLVGDNSFVDKEHTRLRPTIVTGVKKEDELQDNESFGPSASLYVVQDAEDALRMANDSQYGLNAALWTEDMMLALDLSKRLEYGQVHVNSTTVNDPATLPVTGVKGSGWGDNNAGWGIDEWLINKTIMLHRSDEPISFGQ